MDRLFRRIPGALFLATSLLLPAVGQSAGSIFTAEQAASHVGEYATVCGRVASAHYAKTSKGQPTFLNLDRPYPRHIFTIVIWGPERSKFHSAPEAYYRQKSVCVTGTIKRYRGKPEIVVREAGQIRVR